MTQTDVQTRSIFPLLSRCVFIMALTCLLPTLQVYAQSSATSGTTPSGLAPGAPAGSYSLSGFENVNLFNGNLNFSLPLLKIGGRGGAQASVNLKLDSIHWTVEHEPGSAGDPETYDPYHPGTHPPIVGGSGTGTPPIFDVTPDWWEGLRPGYGPGVLQGRVARQGRSGPTLSRLTFTASDGTEYELIDKYTWGKPLTGTNRNRGTTFISVNGASMTFESNSPISDSYTDNGFTAGLSGYLMMADGTRYDITNGLVMKIRDRNGNQLTFSYYGDQYNTPRLQRVHTITDSLGRVVTITYFDLPGSTVSYDNISFSGFGGAERSIKIWHGSLSSALRTTRPGDLTTTQSVGALFADVYADGMGGGTGTATYNPPDLVTSIELPDHRRYWLSYNVYGELARVVLPTGGAIEYDYTPGAGVVPDTSGYQIHRCVLERRVYSDGDTLQNKQTYSPVYTPTYNGSVIGSWKTEVTVEQHDMLRAAGSTLVNSTKHTFYGSPVPSMFQSPTAYPEWKEGREKQVETFDEHGSPLRLVTNTWNQCTDCEADMSWWTTPAQTGHTAENAPPNNPHLTESDTTLEDITPNLVSKQKSVYDKYNNMTRVEEYAYAQTVDNCTLLRRTENSYITSATYTDTPVHLRSLPTRVSIYDANNTERARTTYEYDNYSPDTTSHHAALVTDAPDVISGRDAAFTSERRGNSTSTSYWLLSPLGAEIRAISSYQQFDINGNVVKFIDPLNNQTTYDFSDNFGAPGDNEARTNTPPTNLGNQKTYSVPKKVTNAMGQSAYTQYDYCSGVAVNSEDANGIITSTFYNDVLNRPTKLIQAASTPFQSQVSVIYDDANRIITSTSDLNTYGDNQLKSQSLYDGLGRTIEMRSYENSAAYITTTQEYDGFGRVKRISSPYRTTNDPTYGWTETIYDALGRITVVTTPDGSQVSTTYSGNTVKVKDQANKQRRSTTDAFGRLTSIEEMYEYPSTDIYATTNYSYDVMDNLTGVAQGVQARSFVYDSLKRLISSSNPESGTISYSYDDNNNLNEKTDPRLLPDQVTHIKTTNVYDALNRISSRTYNDGTPAANYFYDNQVLPTGAPALERGTNVGGLLAVTYGSGSAGTYYGFDAVGRTIQSVQVTDGQQYQMSYGYNLIGIMTRQTYPSGRTITMACDAVGRLSSMGGQRSGEAYKQYLSQLSYAPDGSTKALQLGNGLWEHVAVNKRWQTTEIGVGTSSTDASVLKLNYDYGTTNNNGNMRSQTITAPGLAPLTQTYTYDHLNRLTVAEENGGASWRQTFTYDRYGNRNFVADVTHTTPALLGLNPTFDLNNNRISVGQGYSYDAAGDLTADAQGHSYAYDAERRQVNFDASSALYTYDGTGQRVKKISGSVTTIFVYNTSGQMVAEYNNTNVLPVGGTTYITADTLGSPRMLTDSQAQVTSRHDYAPFGEELTSQFGGRSLQQQYVTDNLRQKFTGQERDSETGLDYFHARCYSSTQGRFTSADPLLSSGIAAAPQTWNRYAYTSNNPLNMTDPSGMSPSGSGNGDEPLIQGTDPTNPHPQEHPPAQTQPTPTTPQQQPPQQQQAPQPQPRIIYIFVAFTDDDMSDTVTPTSGSPQQFDPITVKAPDFASLNSSTVKVIPEFSKQDFINALQDPNAAAVIFIGHAEGTFDSSGTKYTATALHMSDGTKFTKADVTNVKAQSVSIFACDSQSIRGLFKLDANQAFVGMNSGPDGWSGAPALSRAGYAAAQQIISGKSINDVVTAASKAISIGTVISSNGVKVPTVRPKIDTGDYVRRVP